jgi:hypothetical protein
MENELKEPKYGEYYLCQSVNLLKLVQCSSNHLNMRLDFSNILSKLAIERLAEADEYEVVREVQVRDT